MLRLKGSLCRKIIELWRVVNEQGWWNSMIWGQWVLRWEGWGVTTRTWRMWKMLNGDWDIGTVLEWDWMWWKWGSKDGTRARGWRYWIWKNYMILEMGGLEQSWRHEVCMGGDQGDLASLSRQGAAAGRRQAQRRELAWGTGHTCLKLNHSTITSRREGWEAPHLPPQCLPVVRDESRDSELRNLTSPMKSPLFEISFSLVKLFPYQCEILSDAFFFSSVH